MQGRIERRGPLQLHRELGGDRARQRALVLRLHQVDRPRPVPVAIEEGPPAPAIDDSCESQVMRLRLPVADELVTFGEAPDAQPFGIRRTASEAGVRGSVGLLQALHRTSAGLLWRRLLGRVLGGRGSMKSL